MKMWAYETVYRTLMIEGAITFSTREKLIEFISDMVVDHYSSFLIFDRREYSVNNWLTYNITLDYLDSCLPRSTRIYGRMQKFFIGKVIAKLFPVKKIYFGVDEPYDALYKAVLASPHDDIKEIFPDILFCIDGLTLKTVRR